MNVYRELVMRKFLWLILFVLVLQGCTTTSSFTSIQEGVKITVGKTKISGEMPVAGEISRTTFGSYPVKVQKNGCELMYFSLPLKVSPGIIVIDALFFAPAIFFNVKGSLPFYEVDLDSRDLKYKVNNEENWITYLIPEEQKVSANSV
jgi:uncharacterized protein YceK